MKYEWIVEIDDDEGFHLEEAKWKQELIRCKDCKYYYIYDRNNKFCELDIEMMRDLDPNYYCASAERKEDDEIQHP